MAHGFPLPQKCIDWNREVLKRELGLSESDIVDIPQLFFLKGAYAEAFFPDMVSPASVPTISRQQLYLLVRLNSGQGPSASYMQDSHAILGTKLT